MTTATSLPDATLLPRDSKGRFMRRDAECVAIEQAVRAIQTVDTHDRHRVLAYLIGRFLGRQAYIRYYT